MSRASVAVLAVALGLLPSGHLLAEEPAPADLPPCPGAADKPEVAALVRRTERMLKGVSSVATMSMSIKTKDWSRKLKMKVWSRGQDFALINVLEGGPRETGLMTLKREAQLWNYLPQAGRVMKLPSGMMGDSWLGSDFTNDDLVNGTSLVDDFTATVSADEGRAAWKVELVPKPKALVVWGRIEMFIDRKSCQPLEERFFDEDGKAARRMVFSEPRQVGWRHFPAKMTMFPADERRETSITYDEIAFDTVIPDDTFSLARLRQGR